MRILFVSSEYSDVTPSGGIGSYVAGIAPALAARGHSVHVLAVGPRLRRRDITVDEVHVHLRPVLPLAAPWALCGAPRAALRRSASRSVVHWIRRLGVAPDIVEVPDWGGEGADVHVLGVPTVLTLHTCSAIASRFERTGNPLDRLLATRHERRVLRARPLVVAPSRLVLDSTVEAWGLDPALTAAVVVPIAAQHAGATAADPSGAAPPVVVVPGRLQERKRPHLAIEAAAELARRGVDVRLDLIGRSPADRRGRRYEASLRAAAATSGVDVRFRGQFDRPALEGALAGARLVLVPSRYESFSMVLVEAMAAARPVVAAGDIGALEHVSAGVRVCAGEATSIAEACLPLLLDPALAAEEGASARSAVRTELDPEVLLERRLVFYRRLLRRD